MCVGACSAITRSKIAVVREVAALERDRADDVVAGDLAQPAGTRC